MVKEEIQEIIEHEFDLPEYNVTLRIWNIFKRKTNEISNNENGGDKMVTKIECDRCGKITEVDYDKVNAVVGWGKCLKYINEEGAEQYWDLCDQCTTELEKWVEEKTE